ncbi:hypothetical protein [Shewanella baltica]|uniref:hypothetical protein n=1 Tax=Shewanella baltica TaxID=62322 RepID=UPI002168944D|nr:hypothetical protein [Shewanella baltica]MCS6117022.1 hypothetical protein [Shewanella baltica]UVW65004.1 hypothetical protein HHE93_16110 [Shewanella baltica]
MRIVLIICLISFISSCSRETHHAVDGFFFSVEGLTKSKLLIVLDDFAFADNFEKTSEGGEGMLPEKKANFMMAAYKNKNGYEFLVNNVLNKDCFSVATYDKEHNGKIFAEELAAKLNTLLLNKYEANFVQYADKYCKIAH